MIKGSYIRTVETGISPSATVGGVALMMTRQKGKCKMKRAVYEVWAKCWSDKEQSIIMKLRGTFEHITDAGIFSAAYEEMYSTKTVTIKVDKD